MIALKQQLINRIHQTGPLTLADYMGECLLHPEHGYYATRDPLGQGGDFTTAPEISQMFGEMLGLALAQCWLDQGQPNPFILAELGPGHGTLMADLLRASAAVPGFHNAAQIHLVEASPVLRARQADTINAQITHHDSLEGVPQAPMFLVANEFFDALPIRQFRRSEQGWREHLVGVEVDKLALGLSDLMPGEILENRLFDTQQGDIVEVCPQATNIAKAIAARISSNGGVAFIVDYGEWGSLGDTFQAVKNHQKTDPFEKPGAADLTAHVDFEALATAAKPLQYRFTTQGHFLEYLGITPRAQTLAQKLQGEALSSHIAAHRRLTHPDEMGNLFKVLALFQNDGTQPPGFGE